jgi:hypothetical protein
MRPLSDFMVIGAILLAGGCAPFIHSPPGRLLGLDTAQTLEKGQTGIQVVGGGGGDGVDVSFGGIAARVRHGLAKQLDGRLELSVLKLNPEDPLIGGEVIYGVGTGIKYAFNPHFAFSVDVTGGGWVGGGFISPELKLIAGYENPAAVPFFDVGYYTSHPISPNAVSTTEDFLGPPTFTQGWTTGVGLRVATSNIKTPEGGCCRFGSALIFGMRFTGAYFDDMHENNAQVYGAGGVGFEFVVP